MCMQVIIRNASETFEFILLLSSWYNSSMNNFQYSLSERVPDITFTHVSSISAKRTFIFISASIFLQIKHIGMLPPERALTLRECTSCSLFLVYSLLFWVLWHTHWIFRLTKWKMLNNVNIKIFVKLARSGDGLWRHKNEQLISKAGEVWAPLRVCAQRQRWACVSECDNVHKYS